MCSDTLVCVNRQPGTELTGESVAVRNGNVTRCGMCSKARVGYQLKRASCTSGWRWARGVPHVLSQSPSPFRPPQSCICVLQAARLVWSVGKRLPSQGQTSTVAQPSMRPHNLEHDSPRPGSWRDVLPSGAQVSISPAERMGRDRLGPNVGVRRQAHSLRLDLLVFTY